MPRRPKFKRGERINSLHQVVELLALDCWIYWNHKPLHPGWVSSMRFRALSLAVKRGILYVAVPTAGNSTEEAA